MHLDPSCVNTPLPRELSATSKSAKASCHQPALPSAWMAAEESWGEQILWRRALVMPPSVPKQRCATGLC